MKCVGVREARDHWADYLEHSQGESVLVMRHGKPLAVINGVAGRELDEVISELLNKKDEKPKS
jgi:antitoxin (DNA-binding transcriptional repressor) of toxin-antitoxin stability system